VDSRRCWIRLEKVRSGSKGRKARDQLTLNRPGVILGKIHGTPPPNIILLATPRPAKSFIVKPGSEANETWSDGADGAGF